MKGKLDFVIFYIF